MKAATIGLTAMVAIAAISFMPTHAEEGDALLVPDMPAAIDIPNAYELPELR